MEVPAPTPRAAGDCDTAALLDLDGNGLRLRRNEVYARHGRAFSSKELQEHFEGQDWYEVDPGYRGARLTADDHACIARVQQLELGHGVLARADTDLDGDGVSEALALLATDPSMLTDTPVPCTPECTGLLLVGNELTRVPVTWKGTRDFAEKSLRAVDVLPGDGPMEVVLTQRRTDWEDPAYDHHIVVHKNGALVLSRLMASGYDQGELVVEGNGRIGLVDGDCAWRKTTWHRVGPDGKLVEDGRDQTLEPGAENFRTPDGSFACPG